MSSQARYCTGNGATIAPIRTMARNAGVLAPDSSVLRLGAKFSADPVYGHA